jgi:hypothetical protein
MQIPRSVQPGKPGESIRKFRLVLRSVWVRILKPLLYWIVALKPGYYFYRGNVRIAYTVFSSIVVEKHLFVEKNRRTSRLILIFNSSGDWLIQYS